MGWIELILTIFLVNGAFCLLGSYLDIRRETIAQERRLEEHYQWLEARKGGSEAL